MSGITQNGAAGPDTMVRMLSCQEQHAGDAHTFQSAFQQPVWLLWSPSVTTAMLSLTVSMGLSGSHTYILSLSLPLAKLCWLCASQ